MAAALLLALVATPPGAMAGTTEKILFGSDAGGDYDI
jgi:hypothetical protein